MSILAPFRHFLAMDDSDLSNEPAETHQWLRRWGQGDDDELACLFAYYCPRLRQLLNVRMAPAIAARVDVSDVLQDVFLDARQQANTYLRNRNVAFYVWLRTLAWQRLIKEHRRHLGTRKRSVNREVHLPADSTFDLAQQLIDCRVSPSKALMRAELQDRVRLAMNGLGDDDREIILLRDFEGMSNIEVAQTLGLSASGATKRYGRALFRLKAALDAML